MHYLRTMVRGFGVRRPSEPAFGKSDRRTRNHTETLEVLLLRQSNGCVLRCAVPSWRDGSGDAFANWSVGRAWRRTDSDRPLCLPSMRTNGAICKQKDTGPIEASGTTHAVELGVRSAQEAKKGKLRIGLFGRPQPRNVYSIVRVTS